MILVFQDLGPARAAARLARGTVSPVGDRFVVLKRPSIHFWATAPMLAENGSWVKLCELGRPLGLGESRRFPGWHVEVERRHGEHMRWSARSGDTLVTARSFGELCAEIRQAVAEQEGCVP